MGILSGKADTREEYVRIWKGHVRDMAILMYAAGMSSEEIDRRQKEMLMWVETAGDNEFPHEVKREFRSDLNGFMDTL